MKAMEKDPEMRYRTATEMIEDLNLKFELEKIKIINMNKYTTYYSIYL